MPSDYVLWVSRNVDHAAVLGTLHGVDKQYELNDGVPRAATWTAAARYTMNPDFPHDTLLTDALINTDQLVVGSDRLKKFLEGRKVNEVEYLPVTVMNHKNRPAGTDYFIINPIHPVDCLDVDASDVTWSMIDETQVESVGRLVLDPSRVDKDRELFRVANFPNVTLARRDLAQAMDKQSFTGVRWVELDQYPED